MQKQRLKLKLLLPNSKLKRNKMKPSERKLEKLDRKKKKT